MADLFCLINESEVNLMGTRQYIGARYVPKFANPIEWDNARAYEALEIVTYLGTSYTSKKAVPVGTAITNSEYWVATGNYNAQVAEYAEQVTNLAESLTGILASENDPYFIFQGDSYAITGFYDWQTWGQLVATYLGLSASQYTILDNSGGGFTDVGDHGNFVTHLQSSPVTGHTVTHIVVCGGANDRNENTTQLAQDIATYISTAKTLYPYAKIYVGMIGNSSNSVYSYEMMNVSYKYYKEESIKNGAIWMESPTWACAFESDWYNELHPNATGQQKIAISIASEILGNGSTPCYDVNELSLTTVEGITNQDPSAKIHFRHRGDQIEAHFKGNSSGVVRFTYTEAQTTPTATWGKIATITDYIIGRNYLETSVCAIFIKSDNTFVTYPCAIRISGDGIYINTQGGIANCISFVIPTFNITEALRISDD